MQKHVNLVDLVKSFETNTSISKSSSVLVKFGFDTAENEPEHGLWDIIDIRIPRFRLYRLRFLQENMRIAAFFKIYQILKLKFLKFDKILQILRHLQFFC